MEEGISVIIPTYNGGKTFTRCLERIGQQRYEGPVQLIVIDSGSTDGTPELAQKAGALVKRIHKRLFHHARTRNDALPLARFDQVVYTVQDAIPCADTSLAHLEKALMEHDVAAVYAEQIPQDDATPYARFETESIQYGRGREPVIHALESYEAFQRMPYHAAYRSIGLDNICAIYRKELLEKTPFPEVDFAEDLAWALKILLMGHKVLYQPDIKVRHSHNRSPGYAFKRQVVNSLWCAKIMGRVEKDLSFVTVKDLMALTGAIERAVDLLRAEMFEHSKAFPRDRRRFSGIIDRVSRKYPLKNRVRAFLYDHLSKNAKLQRPELGKIAQDVSDQIQQVFSYIRENYVVSGETPLMEVLELTVANALGRLYGEVYASRVATGPMDARLEAFMRPFMRGI